MTVTEGMGGEVGISGRPRYPGESRLPTVTLLGETLVPDSSSAGVLMDMDLGGDGTMATETG